MKDSIIIIKYMSEQDRYEPIPMDYIWIIINFT